MEFTREYFQGYLETLRQQQREEKLRDEIRKGKIFKYYFTQSLQRIIYIMKTKQVYEV